VAGSKEWLDGSICEKSIAGHSRTKTIRTDLHFTGGHN